MSWTVKVVAEVEAWMDGLDEKSAARVAASIDLLSSAGPTLGRPMVDRIKNSTIQNRIACCSCSTRTSRRSC
jgi:hypothetical protein